MTLETFSQRVRICCSQQIEGGDKIKESAYICDMQKPNLDGICLARPSDHLHVAVSTFTYHLLLELRVELETLSH